MEHSLHLAAKHFVETVCPVSPASIRKKATAALKLAREGGQLSMDEFSQALDAVDADDIAAHEYDEYGDGSGDSDPDDDETEFTPGDALGKALALVKQVRPILLLSWLPTNSIECYSDSDVASSKSFFQVFVRSGWPQAS